VKRISLLALALAFCSAPSQCATLERLSLDEIIVKSTAIVRGRVTGSYAAFSGSVIYTHYTVRVSEQFKGGSQGSVEVTVPGGVARDLRQTFSGAPELQTGGEYVFFLWAGKSGMNQVIGLTQGLFSIAPGASPDPMATRAASSERMLAPGSGRPVMDEKLVMRLSELRARIASTLGVNQGGAK
jgi:hypothetical protein